MTGARRTIAFVLLGLLATAPAAGAAASPAPGRPDPRFGDGGIVSRDFGTEPTAGAAVGAVAGPDGTTLVLQPGRTGVAVARYLADGRLDRRFGERGIALDPDDSFYEGGKIELGPRGSIVASTGGSITRFTAAGKLDRGWGHGGRVRRDYSHLPSVGLGATATLPDGATIVAGPATLSSGGGIKVLRYGPAGRLDRSYGHGGQATVKVPDYGDPVGAVAPQGDGILVASPGEAEGGIVSLVRLEADGKLDRSFGSGGKTIVAKLEGPPVAIAQQADGKIVVATESNRLVRFTPSGQVDPSFGKDGVVEGPSPKTRLHALVQAPDGSLVAFGAARTGTGPYASADLAIERFSAAGAPDPAFGGGSGYITATPDPKLRTEALGGLVTAAGGLLAVGETAGLGRVHVGAKLVLAGFDAGGSPARGFGTDGMVISKAVAPSADGVTDLLPAPGGGLLAAGHAHGQVAVARFSAAGALVRSYGRGGTRLLPSAGEWSVREGAALAAGPRGSAYLAPGSSGPGGVYRLTRGGDIDRRFGAHGEAGRPPLVMTLGVAVGRGGRILADGMNGKYEGTLVGLKPNGHLDRGFGHGGKIRLSEFGESGYEAPLAVGPGGLLAVLEGIGTPTVLTSEGEGIPSIAAATRAARTQRKLPHEMLDLAFDGRKLVLLGTRDHGLAITRLLPDGSPDPSFGDGGLRVLHLAPRFLPGRLAVEPDGKIVADGVSFADDSAADRSPGRATVIRLDPDGSLDPSFAAGGIFRQPKATVLRMSALVLGPGTVTGGGTAVVPGVLDSRDAKMFLLRLGR